MASVPASGASPTWTRWLGWAGATACATGIAIDRTWEAIAWPRVGDALALAGIASAIAWLLRRWRGWPMAQGLALAWMAALAWFAGPLPVLATVLLAASAHALGSLLARGLVAVGVGLALYAGVIGWLLPLPVHTGWAYAALLAVPLALRRHEVAAQWSQGWRAWRAAIALHPRASAWATLALGLASTGCWLPTVQFDDLVYHLGLPWQLQTQARYALDPTHQVWSLAPWAGDVLQAMVQVLARTEGRGALNALWLLLVAAAAWQLAAGLGARANLRWGAVALVATVPLTTALAGSMQTELPAAAVMLLLALLVMQPAGSHRHALLAGAALFGLLCGLKSMHPIVALPLLGWAALRHRQRIRWQWLPGAIALTLAVGGSSYAYAWQVARNPVLPLFNASFRSPYFAADDFSDPRWQAGFEPALPWRLTLDTATYVEGFDGALGFALLALAGVALVAAWRGRTRGAALAAACGALLVLWPMQYARYLYPSLVLLLPVLAAAMQQLPRRLGLMLLILTCGLGFVFQGTGHWMLRTGIVKLTVKSAGSDAPVFARYAPERLLAQGQRQGAPGTRTLVLGGIGALAELGRDGRTITWYSPAWEEAARIADSDASGQAWHALLRAAGIVELVANEDALTPTRRKALELAGATLVASEGPAQRWRLPGTEPPP